MRQLVKFGFILGSICLAATLVLALTHEVTKTRIEAQAKLEEESALKTIMPSADTFIPNTIDGIEYFEAMKGAESIGYCVKVVANGYNGYIKMIVGIDRGGVIKGLRVLEQNETPGLGGRICEIKPGDNEPWFLRQFKGREARTVGIRNGVDAITGATISSKAIADSVKKSAAEFLDKVHR